jgi:hypothetical protein
MRRELNLLLALSLITLCADARADEGWSLSGDLRTSGTWSERSARDGSRDSTEALRMRARVAAQRSFGEAVELRVRLAGRFASDQDGSRFWLRRAAPGRSGAAFGDTVFDEFWLRWRPPESAWSIQVGRFQTVHALATLQAKGLGQNDSPNLDIHWTDGLRLERPLAEGNTLRLQLQAMPAGGPGSVHLAPLDFRDGSSRVALFAGIDARAPLGPFIQRAVGLHWYPSALAVDGLAAPARDDYLIVTARATAAWPLAASGARVLLGGELGHAPSTQPGAGGSAWQVELDIEDPERRQSAGLVLGRAEAGWLVSSDFRNNDRLGELRWVWRVHPKLAVDARWRWRQEIEHPASAAHARIDRDAYLRMSWRFP